MEWLSQIKQRHPQFEDPEGLRHSLIKDGYDVPFVDDEVMSTPVDIDKLIAAVELAEKALDRIGLYCAGTELNNVSAFVLRTLAQLKSGKFGEGEG